MSPVILQVRELREAAGLTQLALHEKTGLSIATISRLESANAHRIDLETIEKLCRAFRVDPGALFVRTRR